MIVLNKFWRTLMFKDKKLNGFFLFAIIFLSGFIGIYGIIIPSLLNRPLNKDSTFSSESGSNLGYEEIIRVNIDKYGNLTVQGSFQGPQVTPAVNWALPEYKAIYMLKLDVVNPLSSASFYQVEIQALNPALSRNDVYLHIFFLMDKKSIVAQGMADPFVPNPNQISQIASIVKQDLERAFGISNNFTATPIGDCYFWDQLKVLTYAFNFSGQINYDYFLQYFKDHTPRGLADSFSMPRLRNTNSWLYWEYTNLWAPWTERVSALSRSPLADYNSSFECNVLLNYPRFFGAGYPSFTEEQFNLNEVIDVPLTPLINVNEAPYSCSEVEILVENGNITSTTSSAYHIPRYIGLDQDWWLLQNTSMYHSSVTGLGNVSDITVSFTAPLINLTVVMPPPPPTTVKGTVNLLAYMKCGDLGYPMYIFGEIVNEATFKRLFINDQSYWYRLSSKAVEFIPLMSMIEGIYTGVWANSYHYPNGNYYLYVTARLSELSSRGPRGFFAGNVYNFSRFTVNNPLSSNLTVLSPLPNAVVSKNVTISANITNPTSILKVEYLIINLTEYFLGMFWDPTPMINGTLNRVATTWSAVWNSVRVPSTYDYVLRIKVTDINDTFFTDIRITVNNTLFQENIPIYAPMGAAPPYGYDLYIGTVDTPYFRDPWLGGGGRGPTPHSFFGFGVDFGMHFTSLLYQDVIGVFFLADKPGTNNPVWNMIGNIPDLDYGMSILMLDGSVQSQLTSFAIMQDAKAAFNLPNDLNFLGKYTMEIGPGNLAYFFTYGDSYTTTTYDDFIDKFHASIPSGLAGLYTKQNMTQANLNSSIFFGWMNPNGVMGANMFSSSPYKNYNFGFSAYISPSIWFPNYFASALGGTHSISLKKLFPQIPQIQACAPTVASTVLSGFGPNFLNMPVGANVFNANITDWYPKDPSRVNVTPLIGFPIMSTRNIILFTMLNTANKPIGLIKTDDIRLNFTGPFISNNILTPADMQPVQLDQYNATVAIKVQSGTVNYTHYDISPLHEQGSRIDGDFIYNGKNYTHTIDSLRLRAGPYQLNAYIRDNRGIWALNRTIFYVNNTGRFTAVDIYINDMGDVELGYGVDWSSFPSFGYGIELGIDPTVFNLTDIINVDITIMDENTSNALSAFGSSENWNLLLTINGYSGTTQERLREIASPMIAELERVFNIPGMLKELEDFYGLSVFGTDRIAFAMNYTTERDFNYFLDHYETVRCGNLSNLFSKENILRADHAYIQFSIWADWFLRPYLSGLGIPERADCGDLVSPQVWMRFEKVYDYSIMNQPHQFSLAQFLGIQQINSIEESGLTSAQTIIRTHVACGSHTEVFPDDPTYTVYEGESNGYDIYRYELFPGLNFTTDIRFNFTAPYTSIQIISPLSGSIIHGDVRIIANATMLAPPPNYVYLSICPAGAYMGPELIFSTCIIRQLELLYDPVNQYWSYLWETLQDEVPNGWYDLIFFFYDATFRLQRDYCTVHLYNTYYQEAMSVIVEQNGNVSVRFNFQGNAIKDSLDYSIPEYQSVALLSFAAFNAYNGYSNLTKTLFMEQFQGPPLDFGLSVLFSMDTQEEEALLLATPIKDDFERAFGLEGKLSHIYTGIFIIPVGYGNQMPFRFVSFGNNYSPSITYDYFISYFHHQLPSGLNNSMPAASLKATESFLMWVATPGSLSLFQKTNPPTIEYAPLMMMADLFYPQYLGSNFMGSKLTSHSLSLRNLLGIPQVNFASLTTADSFGTDVQIYVENGNITTFYPNIPYVTQLNTYSGNNIWMNPTSRNTYNTGSQTWNNRIYAFGPWDDINLTFEEPISRPIILTPSAGMVVDGMVNLSVLVQKQTAIREVSVKFYTESEFAKLESYKIIGGSQTMPYVRPEGLLGYDTMAYVGDGKWNFTWNVHGIPDGSYWVEFVVETENGLYSYNSTRVLISNSNLLAITVLSPINGATVSGYVELRARITNSTPIMFPQIIVVEGTLFNPVWSGILEPLGSNIYSTIWPSQATHNGTYLIAFLASDAFGVTFNFSVSITVRNPGITSQMAITSPITVFEWSHNTQFMVIGTRNFPIMYMYYEIRQEYFDPQYNQWVVTRTMASGNMEDPKSIWITSVDSTAWDYRVQGSDGHWYKAYYSIFIQGYDTSETAFELEKRFPLGPAAVQLARITSPLPYDTVSDLVTVWVNRTDISDSLLRVYGEVRRLSDGKWITDLSFIVNPSSAAANFLSYIFPNDLYEITVWGTTLNGSFIDRVWVYFSNSPVLSAACITPALWATLTGAAVLQIDITTPYPLNYVLARIYQEWNPSPLVTLTGFVLNPISGYYEQLFDTSTLPDGQYRIEIEVRDFNLQTVRDCSHFFINNPPHVIIIAPINGTTFEEYDPITIAVQIPDVDVQRVEVWINGTYYLMDLTPGGGYWTAIWTETMGWQGLQYLQIRAYDFGGLVSDTEWLWVSITSYTPPNDRADLYRVISTNSTGGEQTIFNQGETVEYHCTIRGDIGSNTYVVTAQTDDPLLQGYLQVNETVTVVAGQDIEVVFSYNIGLEAPTGTYMVQIIVWTDWPWNGGICVDFITITFQVV